MEEIKTKESQKTKFLQLPNELIGVIVSFSSSQVFFLSLRLIQRSFSHHAIRFFNSVDGFFYAKNIVFRLREMNYLPTNEKILFVSNVWIEYPFFRDKDIEKLFFNFPNLESLKFSRLTLSEKGLEQILKKGALKKLFLGYVSTRLSINLEYMKNIEEFQADGIILYGSDDGTMNFNTPHKDEVKERVIFDSLKLKSVSLSHSSQSFFNRKNFIQHLKQLKYLKLENVFSYGLKLNLEELFCDNCQISELYLKSVDDSKFVFFEKIPKITKLTILDSPYIHNHNFLLLKKFVHLRNLAIDARNTSTDIFLDVTEKLSLVSLHLQNANKIKNAGFKNLKKLKIVTFDKVENITDEVFHDLQNLHRVKFIECNCFSPKCYRIMGDNILYLEIIDSPSSDENKLFSEKISELKIKELSLQFINIKRKNFLKNIKNVECVKLKCSKFQVLDEKLLIKFFQEWSKEIKNQTIIIERCCFGTFLYPITYRIIRKVKKNFVNLQFQRSTEQKE